MRKPLFEYFVPHFLGVEHIKRRDVIDLHTRPLASELLADEPERAILILDGIYISISKKVPITYCKHEHIVCRKENH